MVGVIEGGGELGIGGTGVVTGLLSSALLLLLETIAIVFHKRYIKFLLP